MSSRRTTDSRIWERLTSDRWAIMRGRMAFSRKYSDAQREAVIMAQLDNGHDCRETARMANAGELEFGGKRLEPFDIGWRYCRDLAHDARRRRQLLDMAAAGSDGALDAAGGRIVALLFAEIEKAENARRQGKLTPERVAALAKAHTACRAALHGPARKNGARAADAGANGAASGEDFLGEVAKQQQG